MALPLVHAFVRAGQATSLEMPRREMLRGTAVGVQLIEVIHSSGRQTFSRYTVTTLRGAGRRDFVSLRDARRAFDEEVALTRRIQNKS